MFFPASESHVPRLLPLWASPGSLLVFPGPCRLRRPCAPTLAPPVACSSPVRPLPAALIPHAPRPGRAGPARPPAGATCERPGGLDAPLWLSAPLRSAPPPCLPLLPAFSGSHSLNSGLSLPLPFWAVVSKCFSLVSECGSDNSPFWVPSRGCGPRRKIDSLGISVSPIGTSAQSA